jgi:integrase
MFRHGRAMSLYRNGMPLALLSEFLGHANPETTLIYYDKKNIVFDVPIM